MNLVKEQIFEVKNNLRLGCMKCDFVSGEMANQWFPTTRFKNPSKEKVRKINKIANEIMEMYDTFDKVADECNKYYGFEIDTDFDGLNHNVDLFYSENKIDVWVRLIPQRGERNIYIQVYDKE